MKTIDMKTVRHIALLALLAVAAAACGSKSSSPCNVTAQAGCDAGLACEEVVGGQPACFEPVVVTGTVSDLSTAAPLGGSRVVALDQDRAPISNVASSAADGAYTVTVRAARTPAGAPAAAATTLRADAQGYQTFPGGLRTALPVDLSGAVRDAAGHRWVVSGPLTALELLPLGGAAGAWIHGTVARPPSGGGSLVVAEPAPGDTGPGTGRTAIADASGQYAVFNLSEGTAYLVKAYARGASYAPATTAALAAGDNAGPALALAAGTGASFSGGLIFNNGATGPVGVALVVRSTYLENLDRGETPPGLAVQSGANGYAFTGVPDGRYVLQAAYGQEGVVRDISGGGNTAAVELEVLSGALAGALDQFKLKPAVDLTAIDGQAVTGTPVEVASATPVFEWRRTSAYSSASTYRVKVYDALGTEVWSHDLAGGATSTVTYAGSPLAEGMPYQLRILAIAEAIPVPVAFTVLSQSEDLLGVFTYLPPPPPP
jgi:hypothetical protein